MVVGAAGRRWRPSFCVSPHKSTNAGGLELRSWPCAEKRHPPAGLFQVNVRVKCPGRLVPARRTLNPAMIREYAYAAACWTQSRGGACVADPPHGDILTATDSVVH